MDCDRFLEERLGGSESPEFRVHLASCEVCRREAEEYGEIRRLYREASTERYPGVVSPRRRFAPGAWIPSAAAAALLLAVLLFALFGGPAEVPRGGAGAGDPAVASFFRLYLAPWNVQDARWNEEVRHLWERLGSFEGGRR